jgi:hypothetical protein
MSAPAEYAGRTEDIFLTPKTREEGATIFNEWELTTPIQELAQAVIDDVWQPHFVDGELPEWMQNVIGNAIPVSFPRPRAALDCTPPINCPAEYAHRVAAVLAQVKAIVVGNALPAVFPSEPGYYVFHSDIFPLEICRLFRAQWEGFPVCLLMAAVNATGSGTVMAESFGQPVGTMDLIGKPNYQLPYRWARLEDEPFNL